MSDNNLRLQVILNAVDKLTRPFRSAQASSRELAAAVKKSRDAIKQLDQAGSSLDSFRKLQAENQKLGDRLNYARQRANLLSQELGAMGPPSQRQVVALGRQRLAVQRLEERQKKLQQQTALVRAELYRAGISAKDDAGATARLARETSRYNQELSKQEARLKRLGEAQRRMNAARASYARSLEVRDRIAGAGATTTAAGLAMGAPVMAAVKSYTSMEDAMKGVAKQVNGLRDDTREPAKKESTTVKRKRRTKKQKKEPEAKQGDYLVGTDENVLVLNRTYANRSNAERAAKMQWERLQRGVASFSLQLAEGRADLYTEMPVKVSGFKQPIDDAEWTITTLTHTVSPDNGFTTSIELEVKIDDLEME
jgi:phage-related tail protein